LQNSGIMAEDPEGDLQIFDIITFLIKGEEKIQQRKFPSARLAKERRKTGLRSH